MYVITVDNNIFYHVPTTIRQYRCSISFCYLDVEKKCPKRPEVQSKMQVQLLFVSTCTRTDGYRVP